MKKQQTKTVRAPRKDKKLAVDAGKLRAGSRSEGGGTTGPYDPIGAGGWPTPVGR